MKGFKIAWNIITWLLVILCVLLAVALVGVRLFGIEPYIVLSGSMEPEYHVGSIIYLEQVEPEEIQVGDPITYEVDGLDEACTHRVIEVDKEGRCFKTKGDANDTADGKSVPFDALLGKPIFHIPQLGYLANELNQPYGKMIVISAVCVLLLLIIVPSFFTVSPKKEEESDGEQDDTMSDQARAELEQQLQALREKAAQQAENESADQAPAQEVAEEQAQAPQVAEETQEAEGEPNSQPAEDSAQND
ncbi:MAG: signal peptidase I [Clostridia bacterium]|nr:signal peptidase I [Clostridia bacterium]